MSPFLTFLVLAFSVVGHQACTRSRNEQVVKPVFMIDESIDLVGRRDGSFSDFGSGAVWHEIVQENPSPDVQFGGAPVPMEVT